MVARMPQRGHDRGGAPTGVSNNRNAEEIGMGWITQAIIGLVVGAIAKFLVPGRQGGGFIITAILGMLGALLATVVGQATGWYVDGQPAGFIASVIGAVVIVLLYGKLTKGKAT